MVRHLERILKQTTYQRSFANDDLACKGQIWCKKHSRHGQIWKKTNTRKKTKRKKQKKTWNQTAVSLKPAWRPKQTKLDDQKLGFAGQTKLVIAEFSLVKLLLGPESAVLLSKLNNYRWNSSWDQYKQTPKQKKCDSGPLHSGDNAEKSQAEYRILLAVTMQHWMNKENLIGSSPSLQENRASFFNASFKVSFVLWVTTKLECRMFGLTMLNYAKLNLRLWSLVVWFETKPDKLNLKFQSFVCFVANNWTWMSNVWLDCAKLC